MNQSNRHLALNQKEVEIAKILTHVNQLQSYSLNVEQISDWARSINELKPELNTNDLKSVIDKMKMGKIEYNPNFGIQNIFNGLSTIERPMVY